MPQWPNAVRLCDILEYVNLIVVWSLLLALSAGAKEKNIWGALFTGRYGGTESMQQPPSMGIIQAKT